MNHQLPCLMYLLVFFSLFHFAAFGQASTHPEATNCDGDYCWGDYREEGKVKFAMYADNLGFGEDSWHFAEEPLDWLLDKTPFLHIGLYVNGFKIYTFLEKEAQEPERKKELQDKILDLLDKRIIYFGDEPENLQRKGLRAYPYLAPRGKEQTKILYELYSKIFELNGNNTYMSNMLYFMVTTKSMFAAKLVSAEEFLLIYDKLTAAMEDNIAKATDPKDRESWTKSLGQLEDLLPLEQLGINCDWIRERMAGELDSPEPDMAKTKKVLKYLIRFKCTDDPAFIKAAEIVYNTEPSAGLGSMLAKKYLAEKRYTDALLWMDKAITLRQAADEPAFDIHMDRALLLASMGRKAEARQSATAATGCPEHSAKAWTLIGDMYFSSTDDCGTSSALKTRAVYLAAYDAYAKAGNQAKMAAAKEQFPSMEEIFLENKKLGDTIEVGCWINLSTTIRKR